MADWVVLVTLCVSFAAFVTVHVALSAVLVIAHPPRWRGFAAFVVPPLAPAFGFAKRRGLALAWVALLGIYAAARIAMWLMA